MGFTHLLRASIATGLVLFSTVVSSPTNSSPSPSSLAQVEDLGSQVWQDLQTCIRSNLDTGSSLTLEELQAVSLQCFYQVVVIAPDGGVRSDSEERLTALVRLTGITIPSSESQGETTLKLDTVANSQLFTLPVTVGGESGSFLLDTGASTSIITTQTATKLGLEGIAIPENIWPYLVVGEDCEGVDAAIYNFPTLNIDTTATEGILGLGLKQKFIPAEVSGVIGLDVLKGFDVVIDPEKQELKLLPPSPPESKGISLWGKLGVMTAEVKINGQGPFTFLLDTGAAKIVISPDLAQKLALPTLADSEVEVRGFCGSTPGKIVEISTISLKNQEISQTQGVILTDDAVLRLLQVDGIIGQNFLSRFRQHWRFGDINELGFPTDGSLTLEELPSNAAN